MNPAAVLSVVVKANGVAAANRQLATVDATGKKAGATMEDIGKRSKKHFGDVARHSGYVAVGLAGVAGAATKLAADFESSMNTLQAVTGASADQMKALRKQAVALGADTKLPATSAKDAAEAMTEMTKAGVSVKDTMGGVRDVLVLSAAAQISNARAAEIASNAMNAFKLQGRDVKMITDQLANTANASSVEITDVADSFKMAAAVFSGFQSPAIGAKNAMTELNVAIGILGNAGIKGSDAGTSLKQTLLQLTGPSNKAKDAMKALYIAAEGNAVSERDVAMAVRGSTKERGEAVARLVAHNKALGGNADIAYTATGQMRSLADIIKLVTAGTKNMTQEEKNAYLTQIFGADATRSVIALMNAGPQAFDKMTKAVTKQGAAQALAESKMKGLKGSIEALKSAAETLAISFGSQLLAPLTAIVRALASLGPVMEKNRAATTATVAVLGTFAVALFTLTKAAQAYLAIQTAIEAGLLTAVAPFALVAAAIAGVGLAFVLAYKHSAEFRSIVQGVLGWLQGAATATVTAVVGAFQALARAWTTTSNAVRTEVGQWDVAFAIIKIGVNILSLQVKTAMTVIVTSFRVAMLALGPIATAAWKLVQGVFGAYITVIKGMVTGMVTAIRGIIKIFGGLLKGDFGQMWDGVKLIFSGAIAALKGILNGAWKLLKAPVDAIGAGLHDVFKNTWDRVKDVFSSGVNAVIDFLNVLIRAINVIPGLKDIAPISHVGSGAGGRKYDRPQTGVQGAARGGMFGASGGTVNRPMLLAGEEAPTHPEFVIPTNPAYRGRARGLLAQAAQAIGLAQGGVFGKRELVNLWSSANPGLGNPNLMAAIALAESGGNPRAYNPSGASGLWQILGLPFKGDPFDPMTNARMAGAKLRSQGLGAWVVYTTGAYKQYMGNNVSISDSPLVDLPSLNDILGKLPKPSDLPDWLQGLGKYAIGKATAYIKDKVGNLTSGAIPFTGSGGKASGLINDAIQLAASMGFAHPSAAQLTGGQHAKGSLHYSGRAVDFGNAGHSGAQMVKLFMALFGKFGSRINELFYDPIGWYIDNHRRVGGAIGGHGDHIHLGFRKGGVLPYLGSFQRGGVTSREGMAHLHANEAVIPFKSGGSTARQIGKVRSMQPGAEAGKIMVSDGHGGLVPYDQYLKGPLKGGGYIGNRDPVADGGGGGGGGAPETAVDDNTAAIEEQNRLIEEQNSLIAKRIELETQIATNQTRLLALSAQGDQILNAVIAAVNGGIGGRAGLGSITPSYAGGVARYK